MAEFTIEQVQKHAADVLELFEDGWQWTDIFEIVPKVMEIVEEVRGMTGPEKSAAAEKILDHVIDETDIPWLPDSLVDPILKKGVRFMIPMIVKATKGEYKINNAVTKLGDLARDPETGGAAE